MKKHLRQLAISGVILTFVIAAGSSLAGQKGGAVVEVYKTPTCGCCGLWVKHLQQNGFTARVTDMDDLSGLKKKHGVPAKAGSCHTAVVNGYVLEGHVPAADVKRLLIERPAVVGLAVPGMPLGSPGMEFGGTKQPYDVLSFDKTGQTKVFSSYGR
jgi:hypothetical protein